MGQGTKATGLVTDVENKPPRECWNCIFFRGACYNKKVMADEEAIKKYGKNTDGSIRVGILWCCNEFRSRGNEDFERP